MMEAARTAEAVMRAVGGQRVLLRMPAPAGAGAAEELGLATPEFQDVELGPVVFRKAESTKKLVVAARVVEQVVGSLAFDSAEVLFETAAGVVVDGVVFVIEECVASMAKDEVYAYCLTLRAPGW
jgi:hypothetical protein